MPASTRDAFANSIVLVFGKTLSENIQNISNIDAYFSHALEQTRE